jgi:hypothetical protein
MPAGLLDILPASEIVAGLDWMALEEAKKRDWLGRMLPVAARQGEAGLLREPFTPAAVITGQRPGFLIGG